MNRRKFQSILHQAIRQKWHKETLIKKLSEGLNQPFYCNSEMHPQHAVNRDFMRVFLGLCFFKRNFEAYFGGKYDWDSFPGVTDDEYRDMLVSGWFPTYFRKGKFGFEKNIRVLKNGIESQFHNELRSVITDEITQSNATSLIGYHSKNKFTISDEEIDLIDSYCQMLQKKPEYQNLGQNLRRAA